MDVTRSDHFLSSEMCEVHFRAAASSSSARLLFPRTQAAARVHFTVRLPLTFNEAAPETLLMTLPFTQAALKHLLLLRLLLLQ